MRDVANDDARARDIKKRADFPRPMPENLRHTATFHAGAAMTHLLVAFTPISRAAIGFAIATMMGGFLDSSMPPRLIILPLWPSLRGIYGDGRRSAFIRLRVSRSATQRGRAAHGTAPPPQPRALKMLAALMKHGDFTPSAIERIAGSRKRGPARSRRYDSPHRPFS